MPTCISGKMNLDYYINVTLIELNHINIITKETKGIRVWESTERGRDVTFIAWYIIG